LHSIKIVAVGNLNEFHVTRTPCTLISNKSKIRIALFTELSNNFAVIERIVNEEGLRIFIDVNIDRSKSIVKSRLLDSFLIASL
jgi:hypothetical protein